MKKRILLVEDEESIQKVIKLNLDLEGYDVIVSGSGRNALELSRSQYFDLIILDIMLPEISGLDICEQVRLVNKDVSIIMVSAKDSTEDRITGLKMGADDYLPKPFNLEELLLRIKNLLARSSTGKTKRIEEYHFGENYVNFLSFEAKGTKETFYLTKKEAQLLQLLIERKEQAVSREQILKTVWGYDVYPATRTIDNFILSFRKYFEDNPKKPKYFISVRGVGYKFTEK